MENRLRTSTLTAVVLVGSFIVGAGFIAASPAYPSADAVTMSVTALGKKDTAPPPVKREDVQLTLGKERKQIAGWTKAEKLYLAVLIDDSLDPSAASQSTSVRADLMRLVKEYRFWTRQAVNWFGRGRSSKT